MKNKVKLDYNVNLLNFLHVRQLLQVYIHSYWRINIESYREKVITSNKDILFHSGLKIRMMQSYKCNWDWHRQGHFCPVSGSNLRCSIMNGNLRVLFTHGSRKMPSLPSILSTQNRSGRKKKYVADICFGCSFIGSTNSFSKITKKI